MKNGHIQTSDTIIRQANLTCLNFLMNYLPYKTGGHLVYVMHVFYL